MRIIYIDIHAPSRYLSGGGAAWPISAKLSSARGFAIPTVEMSQRWFLGLVAGIYGEPWSEFPHCGLDCPQDRFSWVFDPVPGS